MDIYAENILDHFRHPRNKQPLATSPASAPPSPSGRGGMGGEGRSGGNITDHEEWNHACGDMLHLWLKLQNGTIVKVGWEGTGCAISQAGMSILSEELAGMSEEEVMQLTKEHVYEMLGISIGPRRFKCALMSLHTVKNALLKAVGKPPQSWTETVSLEKEEA